MNNKEFRKRLKNAFKAMNNNEILALEKWTCCQSCGWSEIEDFPGYKEYAGYCFYHQQDNNDIKREGYCHLSFDTADETLNDSWFKSREDLGKEIVRILKENNLSVEWEGSGNKRIKVFLCPTKKNVNTV